MSLDKTNPEKFINNDYNIILLSYNQITNVISMLKNTKRVHLLVLSKEPISSTKEWNVIMQQQFNENYLVLIKKVYLNLLLLWNIEIPNQVFFSVDHRSKNN